jgi:hypothetical protein
MHADDQLTCAKAVCADQLVIRMHIIGYLLHNRSVHSCNTTAEHVNSILLYLTVFESLLAWSSGKLFNEQM